MINLRSLRYSVLVADIGASAKPLSSQESVSLQPTILSHDVGRETILAMVGAGKASVCWMNAQRGLRFQGWRTATFMMTAASHRPQYRVWDVDNDNRAPRRFLSLLRERYTGRTLLEPPREED